jgi:hypothetical protein
MWPGCIGEGNLGSATVGSQNALPAQSIAELHSLALGADWQGQVQVQLARLRRQTEDDLSSLHHVCVHIYACVYM